jgi:hypothetical protein
MSRTDKRGRLQQLNKKFKEGLKLPQGLTLRRKHLRQVMKPREEVQAQVEMKVHEGRFCSTI